MRGMVVRAVILLAMIIAATLAAMPPLVAADLRIGVPRPMQSADPHWTIDGTTFQILSQIFEPLVRRNGDAQIDPALAESWSSADGVVWTFKLRKNARFHNGSPVTGEDILFSLERAGRSAGPVSSRSYVEQIKTIRLADDNTLVLETKEAQPNFLDGLAYVLIVSKTAGNALAPEDYNAGRGMIGSGPYKYVSLAANDKIVFAKNADYWGKPPAWDEVTFKVLPNDATRVAALLAGDVDVIESVPMQNIEQLKREPQVALWDRLATQVAHVSIDAGPEALATNKITGPNGEKLDKNPLADPRVREALKLAIDLGSFTDRIYQGSVVATGQFLLPDMPGFVADIKPWNPDIARARQLLQEAGWENKFKINISVNQAVFQYAPRVAEGIAQAWARIGVPTTVTALVNQVFVANNVAREWPVYVMAFANVQGTAASVFTLLLHTRGGAYGSLNWARYSNPELDRLAEQGMRTMDGAARTKLYQDAFRLAYADNAVIPLWLFVNSTATKKGLVLKPRQDRVVYPADVTADAAR